VLCKKVVSVFWRFSCAASSSEVVQCGSTNHRREVTGADVSGSAQTTFSPRAQFAIKPDWEKDMVFRVSGGLYHQHRSTESLEMLQVVQPNVKAQQSILC
jgi:hypothetical protein